jgi:hypothetical protein
MQKYIKNPMDQTTKNRDVATAVPTHKQQEDKRNLKVDIPEEQKNGGKQEDEGRPQAATKKERAKYRQYEDSQVIIEKIRSYRTQRYPDSEIMKLLDNMPRRTYYNYVKKLQEQDRQIMEQWIEENVEHFSEELMIYREALCQKLREVQGIIDNKNTAPKDKMQAIEQYLAISEKLVKFERSGRLDDMKYVKYHPPSLY